jgi:MazG family protein
MSETPIARLLALMAKLRDPQGGCPWDLEQTFATIAPYTIEEAYEVADAIAQGDMAALKDELGDLLFQVVFHARMAEEAGHFDFAAVAETVVDKMVRRHPHVFAEAKVADAAAQTAAWEEHKARERAGRQGKADAPPSALDGVPLALPALTRAVKLSKRAAKVGFDWPNAEQVLDKMAEEIAELRAELAAGDRAKAGQELGDLIFGWANLARKLEVDPEQALAGTNRKFERRFRRIEALLRVDGLLPEAVDLDRLESLWTRAKAEEREPGG